MSFAGVGNNAEPFPLGNNIDLRGKPQIITLFGKSQYIMMAIEEADFWPFSPDIHYFSPIKIGTKPLVERSRFVKLTDKQRIKLLI